MFPWLPRLACSTAALRRVLVSQAWLRTEIHAHHDVLNSSFFDIELFTPFEFPYSIGVQIWGFEACELVCCYGCGWR
eukprot:COSAG01_NODE_4118_length_5335_cov_3.316272_5_plen_77_part_00